MVLDTTYISEVNSKIGKVQKGWTDHYRFDFGGFGDAPLLLVAKMLDEAADHGGEVPIELQDRALRAMLKGKTVKVLYDQKELGAFALNDDITPWEAFDVLRNNPAAFRALLQLSTASILEKSLPPQIGTASAAAEAGTRAPSR